MATVKLEILLDSENQNDVVSFANLMNAFSGTPSVQLATPKREFPSEALKRTLEAQSPSTQEASTEVKTSDYSEEEMIEMPNTDLKEYVTSLGIDWAKAEGKNTNRKLANLVLEFRETAGRVTEEVKAEEVQDEVDEVEEAETEEAETEETTSEITYNDLKLALGKKVDDHREAIVAKLGELGATKMPNLAEEHWVEMYNFMEAL